MRKLIVLSFISLDGVMQAPGGPDEDPEGGDLQVHGSGQLVQTLLAHDLVDELWLKIYPVTLGRGKRFFGEGSIPAAFTMTESLVTTNGVIFANYKRAGAVRTGTVGE